MVAFSTHLFISTKPHVTTATAAAQRPTADIRAQTPFHPLAGTPSVCTCTLWPPGIPERTQSTCFPLRSLALFTKAYCVDQGSPWTPTVLGVVG